MKQKACSGSRGVYNTLKIVDEAADSFCSDNNTACFGCTVYATVWKIEHKMQARREVRSRYICMVGTSNTLAHPLG